MFKVNNVNTRTTSMMSFCCFSIVDFEQIIEKENNNNRCFYFKAFLPLTTKF